MVNYIYTKPKDQKAYLNLHWGVLDWCDHLWHDHAYKRPLQEWRPTSARDQEEADSLEDSQEVDELPIQEDVQQYQELNLDTQPKDVEAHLNQVMDSLVEQLPPIPFPQPEQPQLLAERPPAAKLDKGKGDLPPAAPVPTPCRTGTNTPSVEPAGSVPLRSLGAHEDGVLKNMCF